MANDLRNKSIGETYKIINTLQYTFHGETIPQKLASYCNALQDILKTHQKKDDNTNPKVVNDYLILPISELNNKDFDLLKEYMSVLNPVIFNSLLSENILRYENQKNLIESNRKYFTHLNESFLITFNKWKFTYRALF